MYNVYNHLKDQKTSLSYLGLISDSITDKFISLGEYYLANSAQLGKLKNKVSFLIAECFQNTVRHGDKELSGDNHKDFFGINVWDDGLVLSSCNLVADSYAPELKKKFEFINSLGPDELKKLHDEVMREGFSSKGGAGLGLIDMARKSGLPLKFNFNPTESGSTQFYLTLETAGKKDTPHETKISSGLEKELAFYNNLIKQNVLLLYKGDFSQEVTLPLIEMMEHNMAEGSTISSNAARNIVTVIEVLQNISKHGKTVDGIKPGVFSISKSNNTFIIEGGNFVDDAHVPLFKKSIESIKAMALEDAIKLYKERLLSPDISTEGNCGLGLLEIARNSAMQFNYAFAETPEKETFFSIQITL